MDDRDSLADPYAATEPPALITEAPPSIVPPILAGLLAAVVGGIAWGLIVKVSDYEVGIVAWGIGFAVGTAVVFAARGERGQRLQVIAVIAALVGILLGKYLSFAFILQDEFEKAGLEVGLISSEMFRFFRESLSDVFGLFDLLWVGLAVAAAWRIPKLATPEPAPLPVEPLPAETPSALVDLDDPPATER